MAYWLLKTEPAVYSFADLERETLTAWSGVRNAQARNNLVAMQAGDLALIYHSVTQKAVVGVAEIAAPATPDVTAPAGSRWVDVVIRPVRTLPLPVTLAQIKAAPALAQIGLVRQSRLSVVPLTAAEFRLVLAMGGAVESNPVAG